MDTIKRFVGLCVCVLCLSACFSTYNGLKAIYPDAGHPAYHIIEVSGLQPTLQWASSPDTSATYDLVILEGPEAKHNIFPSWSYFKPSKIVYKKEKIAGSEHTVEEALQPSHIYLWTVKRTDEKDWSSYNYHMFYGIAYLYWQRLPYRFRTPNISPQ